MITRDNESFLRKVFSSRREERMGLAEGGSLSIKSGRELRIGESSSAGISSAKAESSDGLKEMRLSRWWSLRRGSKSSLTTRDSRAEEGMLAMSQGLLEARVAKILAGIAFISFSNFFSWRFSFSRFEMMASAEGGSKDKSCGLDERSTRSCEEGRRSTIKASKAGFILSKATRSSSEIKGSTSRPSAMTKANISSGRFANMAGLL